MYGQTFNTALTANDSTAQEPLGTKRPEYDGTNGGFKIYRYVKAASDTTVANGTVLGYTDAYRTTVSTDRDDFKDNAAAGIGIGAITAGYYGWIQSGGAHATFNTDGGDDIVAGDLLIIHVTTDGVCDRVADGTAPTHRILGYASADDVDAANTVAGVLTIDN